MVLVYISLGSNLGDRENNIKKALDKISAHTAIKVVRISNNYETEPWGHTDQPKFINAAAALETTISAKDLLNYFKKIEQELGRTETFKWGPRVIDIDILTYGEQTINEPDLIIPHPRMQEREFVQKPLNEIMPA